MVRLRAVASGLVAGVLVALAGGGAAHSAPLLRSDLAVSAGSVGGKIGGSVEVRLVVRNGGPSPVLPGTWLLDIVAPAGTQIAGGSALAGNCNRIGERHVQCRYGYGFKDDEKRELKLGLRIVDQPTGCGRATVAYAADPRLGNNGANIRVTVDGKPGNCRTALASPSPTASESAEPSATPTEEAVLSPDDQSPSEGVLPAYQSNDDSGGLSLASFLVIGGGLVLVVLGGLLIWRLLRKGPEDDSYDDETGPIYG